MFDLITPVIEDFPLQFTHRLHAPLEYFISPKNVNRIIVFTQNLGEIRQTNTLFPQGGITFIRNLVNCEYRIEM